MAVTRTALIACIAAAALPACNYDQLDVVQNDSETAVDVTYTAPWIGADGARNGCSITEIKVRKGWASRRPRFTGWRRIDAQIDTATCTARFSLPAGYSAIVDHHSWCSDVTPATWFAPTGRARELTLATAESSITLRGLAVAKAFERRSRELCVFKYRD